MLNFSDITVACRLWFLRPMRDIHTLQERLEAISFLKHPSNEEVVKSLGDCLKNIKHIPVRALGIYF